jgi:hypothetical protein
MGAIVAVRWVVIAVESRADTAVVKRADTVGANLGDSEAESPAEIEAAQRRRVLI